MTLMNGAPVPGVSSNQVEGSSARVKAGTKNEPPRRRVTPASPFPPTSHSLPPLLLPFLLWLRFQLLCGLFTFLACAGGEKERKGKGGGRGSGSTLHAGRHGDTLPVGATGVCGGAEVEPSSSAASGHVLLQCQRSLGRG